MKELVTRRFLIEIDHPRMLGGGFALSEEIHTQTVNIFLQLENEGVEYVAESLEVKPLRLLSSTSKYIAEIDTVLKK